MISSSDNTGHYHIAGLQNFSTIVVNDVNTIPCAVFGFPVFDLRRKRSPYYAFHVMLSDTWGRPVQVLFHLHKHLVSSNCFSYPPPDALWTVIPCNASHSYCAFWKSQRNKRRVRVLSIKWIIDVAKTRDSPIYLFVYNSKRLYIKRLQDESFRTTMYIVNVLR